MILDPKTSHSQQTWSVASALTNARSDFSFVSSQNASNVPLLHVTTCRTGTQKKPAHVKLETWTELEKPEPYFSLQELNEYMFVCKKREDTQGHSSRDRHMKPGEVLPVDDDGVRGRLISISTALLVTTPAGRGKDTESVQQDLFLSVVVLHHWCLSEDVSHLFMDVLRLFVVVLRLT